MEVEAEIEQPNEKFQKYLIFICWLVYTVAQVARYSYSVNVTLMIDEYGITHAEAGLPSTFYFFAYGIGQIITGIFCKKYNKRLVVTGALIISALCNTLLFIQIEFAYVKYIWMINGLAQSHLWPLVILTIGENVFGGLKRRASVVISTATSVGTFLSYGIGALFAINVKLYRYTFLAATILTLVACVFWQQLKEVSRKTVFVQERNSKDSDRKSISISTILLLSVFAEFAMMSLAISGGLRQWVPSILKEMYNLTDSLSIVLTLLLPLISIVNAVASNWLYEKLQNTVMVCFLMFLMAIPLFLTLIFCIEISWALIMVIFILLTCAMGIIQHQMTTQTPLYMSDRINAGFMAGFLNGCSYLGNALSTYGLGLIADQCSWLGVFVLLMGISIFSASIALFYFIAHKSKKVAG